MSLIDEIRSGEHDEQIEDLFDALRNRQKVLRQKQQLEMTETLQPGQRVRLTGISPKYLNGSIGTVKGIKNTRATVDLDERFGGYGKFGRGHGLRVPVTCVEIVEELDA